MSHRNRSVLLAATTAIMCCAAFLAWPIVVRAFNPQPEPPARFGMVGLTRGQTARLNVANLQPPDPLHDCRVMLGFVDSMGQTFFDRAGAEIVSEVSLPRGHAAFLDLRSGEAFRDERTRRVQFRAGLEGVPPPDNTPDPCANLVATLEIFDNETGRTLVLYQPPDPAQPPPDNVPR
jgi:hypothetical protein